MSWVDGYKKRNGYKAFAQLLQRTEASIMIDQLLPILIEKGYTVFPNHDALRVLEKDVDAVREIMIQLFDSIGFSCLIRTKGANRNEVKEDKREITVSYVYKGFQPVTVTITMQDLEHFKQLIKRLKAMGDEVCYSTLVGYIEGDVDPYKHEYLVDRYLRQAG